MTTFAKKNNSIKIPIKDKSRRMSEVIMIDMHTNQPALQIKNPQKQLTTSKIFKNKICKGVDGVRKFTVKSMTNPYKLFRSKKNKVCGT